MRFGPLVRGFGKIYIAIDAGDFHSMTIRSRCALTGGEMMPSNVIEKPTSFGKWILVLPLVKKDMVVSLESVDSCGKVIETCNQKINPFKAAVSSKLNGRRLGGLVEQLRNADIASYDGQAQMHIDRIVHDEADKEWDIVHVSITGLSPDNASGGPILKAFDASGGFAKLEKITVLSKSSFRDEVNELAVCKVQVSFRKPSSLWEFFLWASFGADSPDGFIYAEDHIVKRVYSSHFGSYDTSGDGDRYHDWFIEHHRTSASDLRIQRKTRFDIEPLFSIVVPLFETPINYFNEMIDSVLGQTYSRWELVLVNASPNNVELRQAIDQRRADDNRIKLVELQDNYGITVNTNAGIEASQGDFICFFDHDDVLEPDILYEYTDGINRYPNTDLLYCDEDKLLNGRYVGGFFKPDYDPVLMLATNLVCHMLTVRKSIIDSLSKLPGKEFDGSQDHNMTLVASEYARNIYHARKILYHWRMHEGSTALAPGEKPWTLESGRLAVQQHLDRMGIVATVSNYPNEPNVYAIDFAIKTSVKVSVVVVANNFDALTRCVDAVLSDTCAISREFVIAWYGDEPLDRDLLFSRHDRTITARVVPCSTDDSLQVMLNRAARTCAGSHLVFLGQSVEISSDRWLETLVGITHFNNVVAAAPKIYYRDDTVRQFGLVMSGGMPVRLTEFSSRGSSRCYVISRFMRCVTAVEADCMVVRRDEYDAVGGFDESFKSELFNLDFCMRLADRGGLIVADQRAEAIFAECGLNANDGLVVERKAKPSFEDRELIDDYAKLMSRWPKLFSDMDGNYAGDYLPGSSNFELNIPKGSVSWSLGSWC